MDILEQQHEEYSTSKLRPYAYDYMNSQVLNKHCPPIVLVGKGSSRAAYACIGGKCIKIAINAAGVAQNKQEQKYTKKHWLKRQYDCFVHTYGSNGNDYGIILSECCAPCKNSAELLEAFGLSSLKAFMIMMLEVAKTDKCNIATAAKHLTKSSKSNQQDSKKFKYFKKI